MTNPPTNKLSPRDIACVRYGKWLGRVLAKSRCIRALRRGEVTVYNLDLELNHELVRFDDLILKARAARDRIFRTCANCARSSAFVGYMNGENYYACKRGGWVPETSATTCPKYWERRRHRG